MSRSPVVGSILSKMEGLITLRAYKRENLLFDELVLNLEKCANSSFCYIISKSWLMLWLGLVTTIIMIIVVICVVVLKAYNQISHDK